MNLARRTICRIRSVAPAISVVLALVLPLWIHRDASLAGERTIDDAAVIAAVDAAPYRIGRWIGADVPLHEAAGQQLKPTAALSRRYVHMDSGQVVEVTIIHSADARNMVGHHPPICYPSNGWTAVDAPTPLRGNLVELAVNDQTLFAQRYEFTRSIGLAETAHIRVLSFFVLPDGLVTPNISDVHRYTPWLRSSSPGVAQVQVLTNAGFAEPVANAAAGEILGGLHKVLKAMGADFHGKSQ